jgi:hypothetical protein
MVLTHEFFDNKEKLQYSNTFLFCNRVTLIEFEK